ncbi:MAG: hypothetical protein HY512_01860 [Candidatus Aenigmarchaeota archaeon]|nr:hypothetical protein [Candidatus Aenigmarchaeota archaeon]
MSFRICLLGPVPKGDNVRGSWQDWKIKYKEGLSVISDVIFVDGDEWKDETKPLLTFGHDAHTIKTSDIIIVNAEQKLGAGTAQEILIAKYFSKPVISILPKDTHHRRSNIVFHGKMIADWIHPFILTTSDLVVESIDDAINWIKEYKENPSRKSVKNIGIIDEAIEFFIKSK